MAPVLNEQSLRRFVALEAQALGHGGVSLMSRLSGLARSTIYHGLSDIRNNVSAPPGRVRKQGGGRKTKSSEDPTLVVDLKSLVEPVTRGDPMQPLLWTTRSLRNLVNGLAKKGHKVCLAHQWHALGAALRSVLVALVTGLAIISAVEVCARLVEAHVAMTVAAQADVEARLVALDAGIGAQSRTVAGIDARLAEIDAAIAKLTERGRPNTALTAMASERKSRDALVADGKQASDLLLSLRIDRAQIDAERQKFEAATGPIRYLALLIGADRESVARAFIGLIVLCLDMSAICLTIAASQQDTSQGRRDTAVLDLRS
jgi:hypothetical protein